MTSKTIPFHYWDSNTFINVIQGNDPGGGGALRTLVKHVSEGKLLLATSTYTLAEVVKPLKHQGVLSLSDEEKIVNVFKWGNIRLYELTRLIAERARQLQWKSSLKPADAVHLATAEYAEVIRFETYDDKLISKFQSVSPDFWKHKFEIGHPTISQSELNLNT